MQNKAFESTPSLKSWAVKKSISENDENHLHGFLSLLTDASQLSRFDALTSAYLESNPTFSETLSAIELLTDLILLGRSEHISAFESPSGIDLKVVRSGWIEGLKVLRYPETAQKDLQRGAQLKALPWPPNVKVKTERRGDRHGVEIKVFISSSTDVIKLISSLERIKSDFPV